MCPLFKMSNSNISLIIYKELSHPTWSVCTKDACIYLIFSKKKYYRKAFGDGGARGDLPSLTAAHAVVTPAAAVGGGSASPPPSSSTLRARLSRRDADVPRSHSARLLRLPPLPAPSGHPSVPPRRRGLLVRRNIPRGLSLLPQTHRTRNQQPESIPFPLSLWCC